MEFTKFFFSLTNFDFKKSKTTLFSATDVADVEASKAIVRQKKRAEVVASYVDSHVAYAIVAANKNTVEVVDKKNVVEGDVKEDDDDDDDEEEVDDDVDGDGSCPVPTTDSEKWEWN